MKNCRSCSYFVANNGNGKCHLHPPEVIVTVAPRVEIQSVDALKVTEQVEADYPTIKDPDHVNSWCNDYKKKAGEIETK